MSSFLMGLLIKHNELKPRYVQLKYFADFILKADFFLLTYLLKSL